MESTMDITTRYLHGIIDDDLVTYNMLNAKLLDLRATVPSFGNVKRTIQEHEGKRRSVYTMSVKQAIMIVTTLKPASLVYAIRELIRLEKSKKVILEERITDIEATVIADDNFTSYSDIGRVLSLQCGTMDMVNVTKNAIMSFRSDNKNRGVCSLYELKEMLSEVTGEPLTVRYVLSIIIKNIEDGTKSGVIKEDVGRIFIPLDWIASYLDGIIHDIIHKVPANSKQADLVINYLGDDND